MGGAFFGGLLGYSQSLSKGLSLPFLQCSSTQYHEKMKLRNEGQKKRKRLRGTVSSSHTAPYSGPPQTDTERANKEADRSRVFESVLSTPLKPGQVCTTAKRREHPLFEECRKSPKLNLVLSIFSAYKFSMY